MQKIEINGAKSRDKFIAAFYFLVLPAGSRDYGTTRPSTVVDSDFRVASAGRSVQTRGSDVPKPVERMLGWRVWHDRKSDQVR
jgi:hypothetical protein